MLFGKKILHLRFSEIWPGQRKRYGRTDGRTDIHGTKTYICLPQGETYNYWETICERKISKSNIRHFWTYCRQSFFVVTRLERTKDVQYSPLLSWHRFRFCWRTKTHISENENAYFRERRRIFRERRRK